jgi:hypothetical protein
MNDEAQWVGPLQPAPTVCDQCGKPLDDHPLLCPGAGPRCVVPPDAPRAPKWQRVEPGTVIPAGQPYRVEYKEPTLIQPLAIEYVGQAASWPVELEVNTGECAVFVDSSWRPPLELPTVRSLILAEVDDRYTEDKVLLTGPHHDNGKAWWSWDSRLSVIPDEINSFEVLWTEDEA